jgi:alpha-methylacyl-CoA racemase
MLLADMGADVIRVDRATGGALGELAGVCGRGKRSIAVNLKSAGGVAVVHRLAASADVLLEGFRPGVAERLGIGPAALAPVNDRLVYGRMTGWGQEGPLAAAAGHDINYIGLVGALGAIGDDDPVVPLNLIGDYGGGALYLIVGVVAALLERERSGKGQVVDAAMVDGAASLMTVVFELASKGLWQDRRSSNYIDGGAPFYRVYETADGGFMAVGALEPQFYARLLDLLGLADAGLPSQYDQSGWPEVAARIGTAFFSHPRSHWEKVFAGEDACVTPVLSLREAPQAAHNQFRETFMTDDGSIWPAPAPRFSRTPSQASLGSAARGADTATILGELGIDADEQRALVATGAVMGAVP